MTTFTFDTGNNIPVFAPPDQAEAVIAAGAQPLPVRMNWGRIPTRSRTSSRAALHAASW
jgi:hypothetical protein